MKSLKKILSIFAAFMMVIGLTMTNASAASTTGTITVNNPDSAETYTAYKILDAAIDEDDSKNTTYSIKDNSEWYDFVKGSKMFTLTAGSVEGEITTYYVTANSVNAAALATSIKEYLKTHTNITGEVLTYDSATKTASKSGLSLGYYFVSSTNGALCNLTTNNPNAEINDKNESHFVKTSDKANVAIGDKVTYTIEGLVPDTTGFDQYTYKITDTMTNGLTFNDDVEVKIGGQPVTDYFQYTKNGNGFIVTIDVTKFQSLINQKIEVIYSATVNNTAFEGTETNDAKLTRGPGDGVEKGSQTVKVYNSQIKIEKVDGTNNSQKLEGAKFVLKNSEGKFYQLTPATDTEPLKVSWVPNQKDATEVATDKDGIATFNGLINGTYTLVETKAPDGYNLLTGDKNNIEVKISVSGSCEPLLLAIVLL